MIALEERIYILSYLWKEAEYNYAFWAIHPEIDWNQEYKKLIPQVMKAESDLEFYKLLMKFYAILQDGHTMVEIPHELLKDKTIPFTVQRIDRKFILSKVPSDKKELLYAELTKVQGMHLDEYIEKYVYPYYWHQLPDSMFDAFDCIETSLMLHYKENEEIRLETTKGDFSFRQCDGAETLEAECELTFPEKMTKAVDTDSYRIFVTKDNIAYIDIPDFTHQDLAVRFHENKERLKKCTGFVIDVRGNSGGMGEPSFRLAQNFISGKYPVKSRSITPSHNAKYHALEPYIDLEHPDLDNDWEKKIYDIATHRYYESLEGHGETKDHYIDFGTEDSHILKQPLVVLTNHKTACAAEEFASYFKIMNRGKIVGTPTYGSESETMIRNLPLGGRMFLGTTWSTLIDGNEVVNTGIQPDIFCEKNLDDFVSGYDRILAKGLEVVRTLNGKPATSLLAGTADTAQQG